MTEGAAADRPRTAATVEKEYDVVVVGAGVAGCAVACGLSRSSQGALRVCVVERDVSEPNRIVGELLQPQGCRLLADLGIASALDGIDAIENVGYSIHMPARAACDVDYLAPATTTTTTAAAAATTTTTTTTTTAAPGRSFHHGRFVQNLRRAAAAARNVVLVEDTVTGLEMSADGAAVVGVRTKTRGVIAAKLTIACDGCWSAQRKALADDGAVQIATPSSFVGLVIDYAAMPSAQRGNVILTDAAIVLVYGISATEARVLVDVRDASVSLERMPAFLLHRVAPHLPEKMRAAFAAAVAAPNALRTRQNLVMTAPRLRRGLRGAVLLGDSLNMRHPLTGGGMTVAFSDADALARRLGAVADLGDGAAVGAAVEAFLAERRESVATINILAMALYRVFEPSDAPHRAAMREGCFEYLRKGGWFARGPVGFLSGVISDANFLALHFFAVALFCVGRTVVGEGPPAVRHASLPKRLWIAAELLVDAAFNILPEIGKENVSVLAPLGRLLL